MKRAQPVLKPHLLASVALFVCSIIWGITFVVVGRALADVGVFPFLAARFGLAALVMAVVSQQDLRQLSKAQIARGAGIGAFMFAGYVFQTAGLAYTTPSKAAFVTGFSVVLVPVLAAIAWRLHTNAWVCTGALAALLGLYYLTVPAQGFAALNFGDALELLCAVMFAFHILFIGRYGSGFSPRALSFLQIATTGALSLAALPLLAATRRSSVRFHLNVSLAVAIGATAVLATVFAFSLQIWAQRHTTATNTALLLALEPIFATITSFFAFGERLGARTFLGGALILAGIALVELKG